MTLNSILKIVQVSIITTASMVSIIVLISFIGGEFIYRRGEDPNNFIIPITTSLADLGSIIVFSLAIKVIF